MMVKKNSKGLAQISIENLKKNNNMQKSIENVPLTLC